jgi:hypothetical protein
MDLRRMIDRDPFHYFNRPCFPHPSYNPDRYIMTVPGPLRPFGAPQGPLNPFINTGPYGDPRGGRRNCSYQYDPITSKEHGFVVTDGKM